MGPARNWSDTLTSHTGSAADRKAALKVYPGGVESARPAGERAGRPATDAAAAGLSRAKATLDAVLAELDENKAENVVVIPLAGKSDIADYMVIASGRSQRHVGAVADKTVRRLREDGLSKARIEGMPACDWVLIDAEDVVVHVFRPEVRAFYNLERIWSETARAPSDN
ncbi:MAG: ribosome silencing factor [Parvularculaceae bacterium]|nr:ribosome silencing factor [Parvularculaceae bacterium]